MQRDAPKYAKVLRAHRFELELRLGCSCGRAARRIAEHWRRMCRSVGWHSQNTGLLSPSKARLHFDVKAAARAFVEALPVFILLGLTELHVRARLDGVAALRTPPGTPVDFGFGLIILDLILFGLRSPPSSLPAATPRVCRAG